MGKSAKLAKKLGYKHRALLLRFNDLGNATLKIEFDGDSTKSYIKITYFGSIRAGCSELELSNYNFFNLCNHIKYDDKGLPRDGRTRKDDYVSINGETSGNDIAQFMRKSHITKSNKLQVKMLTTGSKTFKENASLQHLRIFELDNL